MNSAFETYWKQSPAVKLVAPIALAATLLVVANLFSSSGANRRPAGAESWIPAGNTLEKIIEPVAPRVEQAADVAGAGEGFVLDTTEKALRGFAKNPDGELDP